VLLFVLGGPLVGFMAGNLVSNLELARASARCQEYFSDRATSLKQEVHALADELVDLRSLFRAEPHVSREQFRTFTRDELSDHPAILALGWIPRVPAGQRASHERLARAEGLVDYRIRALTPQQGLVPAPPQSEYYPVFYVEPLDPNVNDLGADVSSESMRKAAMLRAAAINRLALTDPLDLVQDRTVSKGFLVFLPVFLPRPTGAAPNRATPDGFVLLALRASDVLQHVLDSGGGGGGAAAMRFELIDTDVGGKPIRLASSDALAAGSFFRDWRFVEVFEIGGQHWQLVGWPTVAFVSKHLTAAPLTMGVGVFLFWELLGGLALAVGKRARDRAARRQSRVFEVSLRGLSEGVVVADATGRLVFFNAEAERVLAMGPRNVDVPEWSATYGCFYPDAVTPFPSEQLPLARALNGEEAQEEVFIRNQSVPDGVWIAISGMPLRDERGVVEGGVVSVRDVTAARKADEQLRASIKQLEDLQYAVNQSSLVAITDDVGTITYVNDRFSEVSGYAREELLGQNHRILNSGYHPKAYFEDLWSTIVRGQVWRGRIRNRARDGSHFWVDTTIVPLLTDGKPERYLAIRTDITHHMRQEAELARLSSAVEQTADAIIITDVSGVIEYVNPAFEATTGYSRAEAIGQTPRIMKSGLQPPEYYTRLWATLSAGEVFRGTPINRRKNGECYHAEQTITPIRDLQGRVVHYVSVLKDITDRIRSEQRDIEMRYAREVQQRLYPGAAPPLRGFDIAGATFPALETNGDYYDYLPVSDTCLDVVIGDVSGHGLGPALIMAETRAYLRSLSGLAAEPGAALTRINRALCADLDDNRYVALVLARLDASSMRLAYANAGHVAAYHLDSSGAVRTVLDSCGPPLGMMPDATYACAQTHSLKPGDVVVFLTDGITECENEAGAAFGSDAALDVVRAHRDDSAQDIVRHLERATRNFAGDVAQKDDVTVVICKVGR